MKNLIHYVLIAFSIGSLALIACNNSSNEGAAGKEMDSAAAASPASTSATTNKQLNQSKPEVDALASESTKVLISNYLKLKNALAQDNASEAATAGKALADGFGSFNQSGLTTAQKSSFKDIADDAKEMAEHIGQSADKLPHQREHFDMLSTDMYDLVKLFGAGQTLYVDRCPMYNEKKGAIWLSEIKDIKNPYMGSKMRTCGAIKEVLK